VLNFPAKTEGKMGPIQPMPPISVASFFVINSLKNDLLLKKVSGVFSLYSCLAIGTSYCLYKLYQAYQVKLLSTLAEKAWWTTFVNSIKQPDQKENWLLCLIKHYGSSDPVYVKSLANQLTRYQWLLEASFAMQAMEASAFIKKAHDTAFGAANPLQGLAAVKAHCSIAVAYKKNSQSGEMSNSLDLARRALETVQDPVDHIQGLLSLIATYSYIHVSARGDVRALLTYIEANREAFETSIIQALFGTLSHIVGLKKEVKDQEQELRRAQSAEAEQWFLRLARLSEDLETDPKSLEDGFLYSHLCSYHALHLVLKEVAEKPDLKSAYSELLSQVQKVLTKSNYLIAKMLLEQFRGKAFAGPADNLDTILSQISSKENWEKLILVSRLIYSCPDNQSVKDRCLPWLEAVYQECLKPEEEYSPIQKLQVTQRLLAALVYLGDFNLSSRWFSEKYLPLLLDLQLDFQQVSQGISYVYRYGTQQQQQLFIKRLQTFDLQTSENRLVLVQEFTKVDPQLAFNFFRSLEPGQSRSYLIRAAISAIAMGILFSARKYLG